MSYEGYVVRLCKNGHEELHDAHDYEYPEKCEDCGEEFVDEGHVDETNCLPYPLTFKLKQLTPEVFEKCSCCGHSKLKTPATWKMLNCELYWSENGEYHIDLLPSEIVYMQGDKNEM